MNIQTSHFQEFFNEDIAVSVKNGSKVGKRMADPKVCVSLNGTTVIEMIDEAARANLAGADLVEVRFDRLYLSKPEPTVTEDEDGRRRESLPPQSEWPVLNFEDVEVDEAIATFKEQIPLPVIFTVRPVREGGYFAGTEEQRLEILKKAISNQVSWVDLELSIDEGERKSLIGDAKSNNSSVIASHHDTSGTPTSADIITHIKESSELGDIVKVCYKINEQQDALQLVNAAEELKGEGLSHSIMGLGNGGDWVRLHAPALDQSLVYATMRDEYSLKNEGLVNIRDLRDAWLLLEY